MQRLNLEVQTREAVMKDNKRNPNQLRRDGLIPAVVYGQGEPVAIVVDAKEFNKAIHTKAGSNALFTVKMGSASDLTIVKEIQRDVMTRQPIHVDFQRIDIKQKLEVTVPVHTIGEAIGVKGQHGVLEFITREIKIKCLPDDIPASIDLDITTLELHKSIRIQDITPPKGVEFLTAADHIVVTIVTPKVEEEKPKPGEGVEAAGAQPEVISKGKKDEEGAEGAAPAAGAKPAAGGKAPAAAPKAEKK